jgi:acetylornithine/succinyldiaminopimelate/putrescine aminotransferase
VNRTAGTVVRLLPPYIATERDVDEAVDTLAAVLRAVAEGSTGE